MRITDKKNIAVQRMTLRERLRDEYRNCRGVRRMSVTTAAYWSWRLARADTPEQWLDIHTRCSGEQS